MDDDFRLSIKYARRNIRDVRDLFKDMSPQQMATLEMERRRAEYEKEMKNARMFLNSYERPMIESNYNQTAPYNQTMLGGVGHQYALQTSASESNLIEANRRNQHLYSNSKSETKLPPRPPPQPKPHQSSPGSSNKSVNFRHRLRTFFFFTGSSSSGGDSAGDSADEVDDSSDETDNNGTAETKRARNLRMFLNKPRTASQRRISHGYNKYKKQIPVNKLVKSLFNKTSKTTYNF
jgi:hypothetical protein